MRNTFGSTSQQLADTPPNGDFARYVEDLISQQAKALSGGQQIAPLGQSRAPSKRPAQAAEPITRAQTRAAELKRPQVPTMQVPQTPVPKTQATTGSAVLDSWADIGQAVKTEGAAPLTRSFKLPPLLIFLAVIVLIGATSHFGVDATWPILILVWVFVLARIARSVFGSFLGSKPGGTQQRK